jgi:sugar transferase (PEP-CTERM/EpsH1 system associated)
MPLVVHVVNSLAVGGLENGVVNLVDATATRFRHVIVCMTADGPLHARLRPEVEVIVLGKRPGQDPWALLRLVRLLRRLRPLIVHSRNWPAIDAIPAARVARVPLVVHGEHGREVADPEGRNPRRKRIRRALAPLVHHFVTVSADLRRWLIEDVRVPAAKVSAIHNGVDLSRFGRAGRLESRLRLDLPAEAAIVGTVGRLDPVKDQAGLIRAFAKVRSAHPEALLVVVGDGPCRAELENVAAASGQGEHVRLLGNRDDIPAVMSALDVFVLPSIAEGISNTILEAMASGLPVVATRVGGNPELVEDGIGGALVPRQDPSALAAAIAAYVADPELRRRHGLASRQRATGHFSLERMAEAYANLYTNLAAGRLARSA